MQEDSIPNPLCPVISFSDQEIPSFYKAWSKALVVKVLEKSFTFPVIKRRLEALWAELVGFRSRNWPTTSFWSGFRMILITKVLSSGDRGKFLIITSLWLGGPWTSMMKSPFVKS
ncbi:hypothetical protein LINPERPRIM_LOCUS13038 [Linum perenne]